MFKNLKTDTEIAFFGFLISITYSTCEKRLFCSIDKLCILHIFVKIKSAGRKLLYIECLVRVNAFRQNEVKKVIKIFRIKQLDKPSNHVKFVLSTILILYLVKGDLGCEQTHFGGLTERKAHSKGYLVDQLSACTHVGGTTACEFTVFLV